MTMHDITCLFLKFFVLLALFFFSLAGGIIYGMLQQYDMETCVKAGLLGAYKSLHSYSTISSDVSKTMLSKQSINQWSANLQTKIL